MNKGYSLIEMLIVLTIIGLAAFLAPPIFIKSIDKLKFTTDVRRIASSLRYARAKTVAEKTPLYFNIDIKNNRYWISEAIPDELEEEREDNRQIIRTDQNSESADDQKVKVNKKGISKDFVINVSRDSDRFIKTDIKQNRNIYSISFFPAGNSSGETITITGKDNDLKRRYDISIDKITGGIYLKDYSVQ